MREIMIGVKGEWGERSRGDEGEVGEGESEGKMGVGGGE